MMPAAGFSAYVATRMSGRKTKQVYSFGIDTMRGSSLQ
jgi:hypothetical protein